MKIIENKITELKKDETSFTSYSDLIKICVNVTPKEWFTIDEMWKRLRVLKAIESEIIQIEDADVATVKSCVSVMVWGAISQELIDFVDYINSL